jgi:hypothetical protein
MIPKYQHIHGDASDITYIIATATFWLACMELFSGYIPI